MRASRVLVAFLPIVCAASTPLGTRAQVGHGLGAGEELRFPVGLDSVTVPFENWGEHVVIPVSVNGRPPLQMVFDTGMPIPGVLLYEGALVDSTRLAFGPMRVRVGGAGGNGAAAEARIATGVTLRTGALDSRIGRGMSGAITGKVGRITALVLGGHRLPGVVATYPDSAFENPRGLDSRNGNLGGGVLGRFNVAMDVGGSRAFLMPNRRFVAPFDWDMTGLQFDMREAGRIEVAEVLPGSPAASAGIAPGDRLIAVDGVAAEPRALLRARPRFREAGRVLSLTLRRDGRDRVVKIELRRLV